jgi:hypothetical protein
MFHTFLGVRRPNQRGHSIFFRIPHGCRSRYVFLFDQELSSLGERGAAPRFSGGRRLRRSRIWMHKGIASGFEFRPPFSPPRDFSLIPVYRPLRSKGRATPRGCVRLFSQFLQCNHADPLGAKAEECGSAFFCSTVGCKVSCGVGCRVRRRVCVAAPCSWVH